MQLPGRTRNRKISEYDADIAFTGGGLISALARNSRVGDLSRSPRRCRESD